MKNFIVGALIIGISIVVGFVLTNKPMPIGVAPGTEHFNQEYFYGGLVQGGGTVTKTAATSTTWTVSDICDYSVIKWAPSGANSTTTIPSATAIMNKCLPKDGDFKDIVYWNLATTASSTFTMGTGVTSHISETTLADSMIGGLNLANIRFLRASSTAVYMTIDEQIAN